MILIVLFSVGCSASKPKPPKFVLAAKRNSHGFVQANWYVTIKNEGGRGTQTVQLWTGSKTSYAGGMLGQMKVVYSERHTLNSGEMKTIHIQQTHMGIGAIFDAAIFGPNEGVRFLP